MITSFDSCLGVFDRDYEGGDFCAGLTFGKQGMNMLENVAKVLFEAHLKYRAKEARSHSGL